MNPKEIPTPTPTTDDRAMEGRHVLTDGTDLGDASFHEKDWGTTPEAASVDLEAMAAENVAFAEQQAETFATKDTTIGLKAYQGLLVLFPNHPRLEKWKTRIEELQRGT